MHWWKIFRNIEWFRFFHHWCFRIQWWIVVTCDWNLIRLCIENIDRQIFFWGILFLLRMINESTIDSFAYKTFFEIFMIFESFLIILTTIFAIRKKCVNVFFILYVNCELVHNFVIDDRIIKIVDQLWKIKKKIN